MGCYESKPSHSSTYLLSKLKTYLEEDQTTSFTCSFESSKLSLSTLLTLLDTPCLTLDSLTFNYLSYSAYLGRASIFQYLHSKGCSLSCCELQLEHQGLSLLSLFCLKGHTSLLSYYLPFYISNPQRSQKSPQKSAIHIAVESLHIPVLKAIHDYLHSFTNIPRELDFNYKDPKTGENAGLIACKLGYYPMVKFLYQKCMVDFSGVNEEGEGAVELAVKGLKEKGKRHYMEILKYLDEVIGVKEGGRIDALRTGMVIDDDYEEGSSESVGQSFDSCRSQTTEMFKAHFSDFSSSSSDMKSINSYFAHIRDLK